MQEELRCASQSLLTGEEAEHISREEGKQSSNTPPVSSLFTGSSTCCTYNTEGCALASAAGSCLPQRVQWERSKHCLPSQSRLSYQQHPFVLAVGSSSPAPMGLSATEAGSFSTDAGGPVPLAERFGTSLRPRPLRTQNTGILSLRTASRSSSRVNRT